jgi:hypothetical protein
MVFTGIYAAFDAVVSVAFVHNNPPEYFFLNHIISPGKDYI